jgi:two-component sensor histidine kinase
VGAIALIHERLYRSDQVETVEIGSYLVQLCHDVERTLAEPGKERAIQVEAEEEEAAITVPTDRVAPLALIVNELVTNAFKYAYPVDAGAADVRVRLRATATGELELTVADGGVGLAPDFDPATSPGLGLRLVTSLVRQIGGTLRLDRSRPGARFVVTVPPPAPPRPAAPPADAAAA